ncbi:MAG: Rab family GTPase [Promethearchaeota archaeon]
MEYKGKVSVIGPEGTGKTSLILRYIKNTFSEEYIATLGADFIEKTYDSVDLPQLRSREKMTIVYWDMAGQSVFKEISSIYCEGSLGLIIVFDVNDRKTFEELPKWLEFPKQICPDAITMVVGNKTDLEFKISPKEISQMEKRLNLKIEFVSAKRELDDERSNVRNVFTKMASELLKKFTEYRKISTKASD